MVRAGFRGRREGTPVGALLAATLVPGIATGLLLGAPGTCRGISYP